MEVGKLKALKLKFFNHDKKFLNFSDENKPGISKPYFFIDIHFQHRFFCSVVNISIII